jgi:predicted dehydrogenase
LGSNYATPSVFYVNVYGTGGNLYCEGGGQLLYKKAGTNEREPIPLQPADTQVEQLEEFAACAQNGGKPEVDGIAAVKALAIVLAALKSDAEKRPVRTAEVIGRQL